MINGLLSSDLFPSRITHRETPFSNAFWRRKKKINSKRKMNWTNVNVHMSVPRFSPRFILLAKKRKKNCVCNEIWNVTLSLFFSFLSPGNFIKNVYWCYFLVKNRETWKFTYSFPPFISSLPVSVRLNFLFSNILLWSREAETKRGKKSKLRKCQ